MAISLGRQLPDASSDLPGSRWRVGKTRGLTRAKARPATAPLFGLAPGGVYLASLVTQPAVSSYLAVSPLPVVTYVPTGGLFSVALSLRDRSRGGRYPPPFPMESGLSSETRHKFCFQNMSPNFGGHPAHHAPTMMIGFSQLKLNGRVLQR